MINYLLLVHKNPCQFQRLITALNASWCNFFVHIDKKSDINVFKEKVPSGSNVFYVVDEERIDGRWGDLSLVDAALACMRLALEKNADGKSLSDYHKNFNQSMDFALEFITAMTLSLENSKSLAGEAFSYQNPVESDSLDDTKALLGRIMRYGKILSDINAYVAMANEEYQK